MKELIKNSLENSMTYEEYRSLTRDLLKQGKTTGPNQSEAMVGYTELNEKRMSRLDKTIRLLPEAEEFFSKLSGNYKWLVISESWCGDASQIVPVFKAIADLTPSIEMSVVLRDENPELMDHFEQNGSRAIPLVILINKDSLDVLGVWGARPIPAQQFVIEYKNLEVKPPYEELSLKLQKWYNKDKSVTTQKELIGFMKKALSNAIGKAA